jgi:hypothetical protein
MHLCLAADRGASTSLYLATDPEIEEKDFRGKFFVSLVLSSSCLCTVVASVHDPDRLLYYLTQNQQGPVAREIKPLISQGEDDKLAKKLWEFTEDLVKEKLKK